MILLIIVIKGPIHVFLNNTQKATERIGLPTGVSWIPVLPKSRNGWDGRAMDISDS